MSSIAWYLLGSVALIRWVYRFWSYFRVFPCDSVAIQFSGYGRPRRFGAHSCFRDWWDERM